MGRSIRLVPAVWSESRPRRKVFLYATIDSGAKVKLDVESADEKNAVISAFHKIRHKRRTFPLNRDLSSDLHTA